MIRTIPLKIQNEYITGDKGMIGAAGSHNDVILRMEFSGMWDGLTKMVQFRDALGEATIEVLLTADMLEADDTSVYLVPVPNGAKKYAGEMTLCIKGAAVSAQKEIRATLAVYGRFTVAESKWSAEAETEADVPASNVEQLQGQIENVLATIVDARKAATEAASSATAAKASEDAAAGSAEIAAAHATLARKSEAVASERADNAANSASAAAESIKHAPRINANGKWELWDATKNAYVATEYTAIGKDGTKWWTYAYPIGITAALEKIMSKSNLPDADIGDYVLHTMSNAGIVFEITGETADGSSWVVKEKCTLRGTDGTTPSIGENGNWFLGETDTGVKAEAEAATHETAGIVKPDYDFDIAEDGTLSLYKALMLLADVVPAKVEKGATQTTATVKWATNKTPTSVTVEGESVSPDTTNKELTGLQITAEKEFTVVAADSRGSQTATAVMRFCNGVYTGAAAAPADVDGTFIRTLTKTLQSYKARTFTVNAAAGQYIWYACPAGYGTPVFNVGGFDGGFGKVATLDYTNPSGYTESYQVWRSDNAGLGQTTVNVS